MEEDALLILIEKKRKTTLLKKWIADPYRVLQDEPILLLVLSGFFGALFFAVGFSLEIMSIPNLIVTTIIMIILPPGLYDYYKIKKIKAIEDDFPDFLRDLAFSIKSGLRLDIALNTAVKGEYGKLNEGVRAMARDMSWGSHFEETLRRFAQRYPTPLVKRAVSIIIKSMQVGGDMGLILETVANNALDIKRREEKRKADTAPYITITYVTFLVFLGIMAIIYTQFIPLATGMSQEPSVRGLQFSFVASPRHIELYKTAIFHAVLIQGFGGGIMAGKVGEGRIMAGLKHSIVMVAITYLAYFFIFT